MSEESQYNNIGENYVSNQRNFFQNKEDWTRNKLRSELGGSGLVILDVGCGGGDDMKWAEGKGHEVHGIDPSEKMVQLAKSNVGHPDRVHVGSYESIPFPDEYLDMVMGRFSLHYLEDFSKAYKEITRVLKKGGKLLQVVSHPTFDQYTISQTKEKLVSVKLYNGKITVTFPPHHLSDYFSEQFLASFDLQEIDESDSVDAENPAHIPETLYFFAIKR